MNSTIAQSLTASYGSCEQECRGATFLPSMALDKLLPLASTVGSKQGCGPACFRNCNGWRILLESWIGAYTMSMEL